MKRLSLLIVFALLMSAMPAIGQEIYRWIDEKGTAHFSDDPNQIPSKYRDQVEIKKIPQEPPSEAAAPSSSSRPGVQPGSKRPVRDEAPANQPPERKDILGRGQDWWRGEVRRWNEKLMGAQKNYAGAMADLKNKEKEIDDAKFKPDSLKRRLKGEMKVLIEKVSVSKKEVDEAKNMLENILPKQAEEHNADPMWLR